MARLDSHKRFDSHVRFDESRPARRNMNQDLINQTMSDVQRDAMLGDLSAFDLKFEAFKVNLSPDQVRRLAKLNVSDLGLLKMAYAYAIQNPDTVPANAGVAGLATDIALIEQLIQVFLAAQQKADTVRNSMVAGLSDGFKAGLRIYGYAQVAGRSPENAAFLDAFGERFTKGGEEEPPTPPAQ